MKLRRPAQLALLALLVAAMLAVVVRFVVTTVAADSMLQAAQKGDVNGLASALRRGADPNEQFEGGDTALMLAVANDRFEPARLLLQAGADPNLKNFRGQTALDLASFDRMRNLLFKYHARSGAH